MAICTPNGVIARSEATWQSQCTDRREISIERHFLEIATASSKPRNDRIGGIPLDGFRVIWQKILCRGPGCVLY